MNTTGLAGEAAASAAVGGGSMELGRATAAAAAAGAATGAAGQCPAAAAGEARAGVASECVVHAGRRRCSKGGRQQLGTQHGAQHAEHQRLSSVCGRATCRATAHGEHPVRHASQGHSSGQGACHGRREHIASAEVIRRMQRHGSLLGAPVMLLMLRTQFSGRQRHPQRAVVPGESYSRD